MTTDLAGKSIVYLRKGKKKYQINYTGAVFESASRVDDDSGRSNQKTWAPDRVDDLKEELNFESFFFKHKSTSMTHRSSKTPTAGFV